MLSIDQIIDEVLQAEGGYVNDPADAGGETNYGITVAVARAYGYTGAMRDLPVSVARSIYSNRYITTPGFDRVLQINEAVGIELIDTGVNMGPSQASEFLQRWLNALNDTGSRYQTLFVDGRLGPITYAALEAYLKWRGRDGQTVLVRGLNSSQGDKYLRLTESRPANKKFLFGWMLNRVRIA